MGLLAKFDANNEATEHDSFTFVFFDISIVVLQDYRCYRVQAGMS